MNHGSNHPLEPLESRIPVILIVDDDPNNLGVVQDSLIDVNYTILAAEDGDTAVARAVYAQPDLILLDVMMPGIDGYETCRRLKANPVTAAIPVIFMTALAETGHKVKGLEAGAVDYITKPFQQEELLARIAVHLQIQELTRKLREANETLEQRVESRTIDLSIANNELEQEIAERQAAQEQLQEQAVILEEKYNELELMQSALAASEQKFRAIFDQTYQLMGVLSPAGILLDANQTAIELFGGTQADISNKPFWETPWWSYSESQRELVKDAVTTAAKGEFVRFEAIHQTIDGKIHVIDFSLKPVFDTQGQVVMLIPEGRDITDLKKLEKDLRQSQKMEAIGTLAAGIAHDFNNILMVILGFTEMAIHKQPEDSLAKPDLEKVYASGIRAAELVRQILTYCRQSEQEKRAVHLPAAVKDICALLRSTLPSTIEIRQDIHSLPSGGIVQADPTQFHQILMNLGTNASHAMRDKGGILTIALMEIELDQITAAYYPDLKIGTYLRLTASDTGHGMTSDIMERIFDPYFTTKKTGEGTGLGLAVVSGIVKNHGGIITVYSEPGCGSTFHIYLPVTSSTLAQSPNIDQDLQGGNEHVLFVDDEDFLVSMGRELLEGLGYRVTPLNDSLAALDEFRQRSDEFDLVITDMTMPKLTGRELSQELRAIRPDIPIIICSGYTEFANSAEAKQAGFNAFLMKPYATKNLAEAIRISLHDPAT